MNRMRIWSNDDRRVAVPDFGELHTHTGVFLNEVTTSVFLVDVRCPSCKWPKKAAL
jgi:hypothetical protein